MPTALITGAGRGLGLEFAQQYAADGWSVIGTIRDLEQGAALAQLGRNVEPHSLDLRDRAGIRKLAAELKGRAIDLLICNAGIYGPRDARLGNIDYEAWDEVLRVNVLGPAAIAEAFAEHVARGEGKRIVMLSSQMGSIGNNSSGGGYPYRTSKAALNMVVKSLSIDLAARGVVVIAVHPGWVRTDMGGPGATLSATASVEHLRRLIDGLRPADTGKFWNHDGSELAW